MILDAGTGFSRQPNQKENEEIDKTSDEAARH